MNEQAVSTTRQAELDAIVKHEVLLTTADNPFNPHTQWRDWYAFDSKKGYNTCAYLARIVKSSHELSESDEVLAINDAIKEILELNITGLYIAVTEENFKRRTSTIRNIRLLKQE